MTESSLGESFAFGLSVRAWIALSLVWTVCYMAIYQLEVKEPLYSLALLAVGFYFGQRPNQPTQAKKETLPNDPVNVR